MLCWLTGPSAHVSSIDVPTPGLDQCLTGTAQVQAGALVSSAVAIDVLLWHLEVG
jgi:hypothetical protein